MERAIAIGCMERVTVLGVVIIKRPGDWQICCGSHKFEIQ